MHHSTGVPFACPSSSRYLTNQGTEYLRSYLHLPAEIVPSTYKRAQRSETARVRPTTARDGGAKPQRDRADYRHASGPSGAPDKKGDVGPGATEFEFVSFTQNGDSIAQLPELFTDPLFLFSTADTDAEPSLSPNRFITKGRLLDGD